MEDLSLHILDVAENGIRAGATLIKILVDENLEDDLLTIVIKDNGCRCIFSNIQCGFKLSL